MSEMYRGKPRDIEARVRPGMYYRPTEWDDGSLSPGSTCWVTAEELEAARHLLVQVGSDEDRAAQKKLRDRGSPSDQKRDGPRRQRTTTVK